MHSSASPLLFHAVSSMDDSVWLLSRIHRILTLPSYFLLPLYCHSFKEYHPLYMSLPPECCFSEAATLAYFQIPFFSPAQWITMSQHVFSIMTFNYIFFSPWRLFCLNLSNVFPYLTSFFFFKLELLKHLLPCFLVPQVCGSRWQMVC